MNQIILSGEVINHVMKISDKENTVIRANITLLVPGWKKGGGRREYSLFDCVAFDDQAEYIMKNIRKNMRILVSGRLHAGQYTKDGVKINTKDIIIENIEIF